MCVNVVLYKYTIYK